MCVILKTGCDRGQGRLFHKKSDDCPEKDSSVRFSTAYLVVQPSATTPYPFLDIWDGVFILPY